MDAGELDEGGAQQDPLIFYKIALRKTRARRLAYEAQEKSREYVGEPGVEACYEDVVKGIDLMQDFIGYIAIVRQLLQTIVNNEEKLKNPECHARHHDSLLQEITRIIQEIQKMKLPSSAKLYRERFEYYTFVCFYWQSLLDKRGIVQSKRTKEGSQTLARLAKVEKNLHKINVTRILKRILMGTFFTEWKKYPELHSFRSPIKRNLTVHDFKQNWHYGFEPAVTDMDAASEPDFEIELEL